MNEKRIQQVSDTIKENAEVLISQGITSELKKIYEIRGGKILTYRMKHINQGIHTSSFMGSDLIELANRYAEHGGNIAFKLTNTKDFTNLQLFLLKCMGDNALNLIQLRAEIA